MSIVHSWLVDRLGFDIVHYWYGDMIG